MSDVAAVDPQRLVAAMEDAGFRRAGGREGVYVRLAWPGADDRDRLLVPLDPAYADFDSLLGAVWAELTYAAARGAVAAAVMETVAGHG